jgi:hypothetical protein
MREMEKVESDASSSDSKHVSDTKAFPLATVDEPVMFDTAGKTRESAWDPKFQWEAKEEKKLVRKVSDSSKTTKPGFC